MTALDYYKKFDKIGKAFPGMSWLGSKIASQEFIEAILFLYQNSLNPHSVSGGLFLICMIILILNFALLIQIIPLLSAFVLSSTLSFLIAILLYGKIISKYKNIVLNIDEATPYVLEELCTLFITTHSVFEGILYVSRGSYGYISSAFSQMIGPLNIGVPPEQLLTDFAENQPSTTLRRGVLTFIQLIEFPNTNFDVIIKEAHENLHRRYERLTMQWESRMMVYVGLLVFLPIIIVMGLAIRGLTNSPFVFLLPLIQYGLSSLILKKLLPSTLILVGE